MSFLKTLTLAVAVTGFVSTQVLATTITNKDRRAHSVYVEAPTVPSDLDNQDFFGQYVIGAGKSMQLPCGQTCTVRLANSSDAVTAANSKNAVIKAGKIQIVK